MLSRNEFIVASDIGESRRSNDHMLIYSTYLNDKIFRLYLKINDKQYGL